MRVTFVLPDWRRVPVGGYKVTYEYAARLVHGGHEVTVVHAPEAGGPARMRLRQAARRTAFGLPFFGGIRWFHLPPAVRSVCMIRGQTRRLPPGDALVATAWDTAAFVASAPADRGGKFYLIQHYEDWSGPQAAVDETWRLPMRKVVIARWLFQKGLDLGVPEADMRYIPNGIDMDEFRIVRPIEARDDRRVAMLYHEAAWKGVEDGLSALEQARVLLPSLAPTLFGTVRRPPQLPSWIAYRHAPVGAQLRALYNDVAVFLHTSRSEGWGLPPAEAMACGAALVAAANPGVRDYAVDGHNALLAPIRNPAGLGRQLVRLLTDADLRHRIAVQGAADIGQYTWERAVSAFETVLAER